MATRRFEPTRREPLWPPAGTPEWPYLPSPPAEPPCPVVLGDCKVGDHVLLCDGTEAEIEGVGSLGVRLRPFTTSTSTVDDHCTGKVATFTVHRAGYTIASSATCQAVIGHTPPKVKEKP
jgi:hypothetical protein